jgi:NTE family protein
MNPQRRNRHNAAILTALCALFCALFFEPLCAESPRADVPRANAPRAQRRPRVALVLQGGGALGIAHIGVLKTIEEVGIPVDIVVGTSMGSIIGGLYSIGYTPDELERLTLGADWISLFFANAQPEHERFWDRLDRSRYFASVGFNRQGLKFNGGLLSDRRILTFFDRLTLAVPSPSSFDSFPIQYRAVATDCETGERVVMSQGSLTDAMRASMSIPGVFSPYYLDGRYLIDGGVVDNLPVDVARELGADIVIAVQLSGGKSLSAEAISSSPVVTLKRTMDILMAQNVQEQVPHADYVLNVDLSGYQTTDFLRGEEILALGKNAALAHHEDFVALKRRIDALGGTAKAVARPEVPPITAVEVEGVTGKERAKLVARLETLEGAPFDGEKGQALLSWVDQLGLYQSIRFYQTTRGNDTVLVLWVEKRTAQKQSVRLGYSSALTYGETLASKNVLSPGLVLRGLTTPESKLSLDFGINDRPEVAVAFLQPAGGRLFAELAFRADTDTDTYVSSDSKKISSEIDEQSTSFRVGYTPFDRSEIAGGLRYDRYPSRNDDLSEILSGPSVTDVPIAFLSLKVLLLDSFIFPQKGFYLSAAYQQGIPNFGDSRDFRTFTTSGCLVPPIDIPLSTELEWMYGTDFSSYGDESRAAPLYYKANLSNRRMFPGVLNVTERIGSYAWGVSLLEKYQLNWSIRALKMPIFVLLHGAVGTVLQDYDQIQSIESQSFWNSDCGLGMRINDGFGIMFRAGATARFNESPEPFCAIDLGSFGIR